MTPTVEDRAAMGRLLGVGDPDPKMDGLTGVELCVHPMSGMGDYLLVSGDPLSLSADVREEWLRHPYYHHNYVSGTIVGGHPYCKCGNSEGHDVHIHCWESVYGMPMMQWARGNAATMRLSQTCDDCGRSDGTHNPAVDH